MILGFLFGPALQKQMRALSLPTMSGAMKRRPPSLLFQHTHEIQDDTTSIVNAKSRHRNK